MTRRRRHLDAATTAAYADGTLPAPAADAADHHLDSCARCAAAVSAAVRATAPAARTLATVRESVLLAVACAAGEPAPGETGPGRGDAAEGSASPHPGPLPAGVRTSGRRFATLLWAVGPALRGPWAAALLLVCAGAVGWAHGAGSATVRPLLALLAPLLPVAGVALSYGPGSDPMHEIVAATPSGGLRLLLTRTAAVLAVSLPLLTAAGAWAPAVSGAPGAAAWLLPGLTLTLAALVLGSFTGCRTAARIVAAGWTAAVAPPVLAASGAGIPTAPALAGEAARCLTGPAAQTGWAVAAALCAALFALRRHSFDRVRVPPPALR